MPFDYHIVFGALSVLFGLLGFGLYFKSIFKGDTKPHVFTWASFALIDAIVFVAQIVKGAGPGAWAVGLGALLCTAVAIMSLRVGHLKITVTDWIAFLGALLGIVLWRMTDDPLYAVILASAVNVMAILPTIRKSFDHPRSESITVWSIDIFRYLFSLFALVSFTATTALFPASIIVSNAAVIAVVLFRRRQLPLA